MRSGARERLSQLRDSISAVVHGKNEVVDGVLIACLARGHVLLEDVPGVGKTTLAMAVARALGASSSRIQFTSDLLPSDVIGVSVYRPEDGSFSFKQGPVFAQLVLADEINRSSPKTQSSLLEAMAEGRVTVDGRGYELPQPFLVIATQNPLEHHGTFPLPESQLDRFLLRLTMGYPDREAERRILRDAARPRRVAAAALTPEELVGLQEQVDQVRIHESLEDYLLALIEGTRRSAGLLLGASPRATQALARSVRARAFLLGRDYVVPDDVKALAVPVLAHRLVPASASGVKGATRVLNEILHELTPPR